MHAIDKLTAANCLARIEPHAAALEKIADDMDKDAIGGHPTRGHAVHCRNMASSMRADAVNGKMPHLYDPTGIYHASGDVHAAAALTSVDPAIASLFAPLIDGAARLKAEADALARRPSPAGEAILAGTGIAMPRPGERIDLEKIDEVMSRSGLSMQQRIEIKNRLAGEGLIN